MFLGHNMFMYSCLYTFSVHVPN